jgi:hypothetical protein
MRASSAVPGIAIALGALFVVPHAFAHHSFAPHFDSSKPANISGTITEFGARIPTATFTSPRSTRTAAPAIRRESYGVTQLSRNGIKAEMLKVGTKVRVTGRCRHSAYMCFFDNVECGRPHAQRQRPRALRPGPRRTGAPDARDIFAPAACADPEPHRVVPSR